MLLGACSDATRTPGGNGGDEKLRDGLIVSGPIGAAGGLSASGPAQNVGAQQVYVSMPPGTLTAGDSVRIGVVGSSALVTAPMGAGGFDPVPITASVGDSLDVSVFTHGAQANHTHVGVSTLRQPSVVRTTPATGRTDVPLNQQIVIVFTQPLDASTVTNASIQLTLIGTPVPATVSVEAGAPWVVTLSPSALLSAKTQYKIDVATTIRDANGLSLATGVSNTFSTATSASAIASISVVANGGYAVERRGSAAAVVGGSADFTAGSLSAGGDTLVTDSAATFVWSSSDRAIATVTSSGIPNHQVGTALAVGVGTAELSACIGAVCGIGELDVRSEQSDVQPVAIPELSGVASRVWGMSGDVIIGSTFAAISNCEIGFVVSPVRGLETLPPLPGQCSSSPSYVNANGEVIGEGDPQPDTLVLWTWSRERGTQPLSVPVVGKGLWEPIGIDAKGDITFASDSGGAAITSVAGVTQILTLPVGTELGSGLNGNGQVVLGKTGALHCDDEGCFHECGTVAYVWSVASNRIVSTLEPHDPSTGHALGICAYLLNDAGMVSGIVFPGEGRTGTPTNPETVFRWTPSKGFEFFQVDPGSTESFRMNESGDVTVYLDSYVHIGQDSLYNLSSAIWLADGRAVRLGSLGGDHTAANGLNDHHLVAGHSQVGSSTGRQQAVTWNLSTLANSQVVSASPTVRTSGRRSVALFQNSPRRPIPREYALHRGMRQRFH